MHRTLAKRQELETRGSGGASQPAEVKAHMVVSREYVGRQIQKVIEWRETWLRRQRLPLSEMIRGELADQFLEDAKNEFHASAEQRQLKQRDAEVGDKKSRKESIPGGVGTRKC